jgi:hypothetical protein
MLERKLVQQIKLTEGRLTRLELQIKGYEERIRDFEERDDLTKQYQELSEAQNQFINIQKTRICDLERQNTVHTAELARTCQLNRNLSATLREKTISEPEQQVMEDPSNCSTIATFYQNHGLYESPCLKPCDSKTLSFAGQDDRFAEFYPGDHIHDSTGEPAEPTVSQAFTMTGNATPTTSQWQYKESDSPIWQMSCWPTSATR